MNGKKHTDAGPWAQGLGLRALAPIFLALPMASARALEVHEWGTFTTLSSSAGYGLSGLFVDATRLPAFVHGLPYFNYDSAAGWASPEKLRHVTVKMETPVLYFYTDRETPVDVKVEFRGGTISQWYPQCYLCEAEPTAPFVDFAQAPYAGHIGWKATVLAPGPELPYTTTALGGETQEWVSPRNTTANQLRGQRGEIEKFLFYRGLGSFASPLSVAFKDTGTLAIENRGEEDIPWVMVYERTGPNESYPASIWQQGPLKAHGKISAARPEPPKFYTIENTSAMDTLYNHLVLAGLTTQEARALLRTWYTGYFIEGGLKVFWILPRARVDRILPLEIKPAPDKLVRVMVGRSEILTPEFERELYRAQADDSLEAKYASHRYYAAYREFLSHGQDWHLTTSLGRIPAPPGHTDRYRKRDNQGGSIPGPSGWTPWFSKGTGTDAGTRAGHPPDARDPQGRSIQPAYQTGR